MKFLIYSSLLALLVLPGCIHKDFDEPPTGGSNPDIDPSVIMTISDLKSMYNGNDALEITDSIFITGIVTADDKSGNFYQTIVIEDESAGISIRIGISDFFNQYPIGRRMFIYVKGLYLGEFGDLVQIGVPDPEEPTGVERIPNFLVDNYLFPGEYGLEVTPTDVTIAELNANRNAFQNRLIRLSDVEVANSEVGETYADGVNQQTINRTIFDCDNRSIILRNSGFASFASDEMPSGNGTLTAIFSIFADDNQLLIRNTDDLVFDGLRCNEQPIVCDPVDAVDGVVEDFTGLPLFDPVDFNGWLSIPVVGNEAWQGRDFSGNSYPLIQGFNSDSDDIESWLVSPKVDFSQAMELTFETKLGFWKHDGLKVFISTDFDGCNVLAATWTELTDATIANSVNSPDGIDGYSDFFVNSGTVDLSDYDGEEGYIGFQYIGDNSTNTTTYQLDNVAIGEEPPVNCDPVNSLNEDFESIATGGGVTFTLDCWSNIAVEGSELWQGRDFSDNAYPQISGFNSNSNNIETYLITPEIDLGQVSTLTFETKSAFCVHEGLDLLIATDYDGVDPDGATWTTLSAVIASDDNQDCDGGFASGFIASGDVDLSGFSGNGHIAFRYTGNNSDETTTYQVDNVVIQ